MELAAAPGLATTWLAAAAGTLAAVALATLYFLHAAWLSPAMTRRRLRKAGFGGPAPSFALGNLPEIAATLAAPSSAPAPVVAPGGVISSDIHGAVFPYFARWRAAFGKVFVYWLGTEPFVYVADPEFLKSATGGAMGRLWGKPDVFRRDRMPMFGRGLVMAEGDEWARHRHVIAPAFSATNLNDMISLMEEATAKMLGEWDEAVAAAGRSAAVAVDVERGVVRNAAEIIARASFGIEEGGARVFEKLQAMQTMLFRSNRLVGVPLARLLHVRKTYEAWKLGREIDALLLEIIDARRHAGAGGAGSRRRKDLLSLLLAAGDEGGKKRQMTSRELVDECKTFFFGGHETTALAVSWTLLMLAAHPEWQRALREEVREVAGDGPLDAAALSKLTKMGWVFNEVLRLYPPSPNVQRQALHDVTLDTPDAEKKTVIIPRGTNMWIDVVAMHHDEALWGPDVNEFRPERFAGAAAQGGCGHRLGYLPFGFGGRICVGRNLTGMEYRVVLAMVLRRFELAVAPEYRHKPRIMLSLRPSDGIQLLLTPLASFSNAAIKH